MYSLKNKNIFKAINNGKQERKMNIYIHVFLFCTLICLLTYFSTLGAYYTIYNGHKPHNLE